MSKILIFCSEYSNYCQINSKAIDKSPKDQPTSVSQGEKLFTQQAPAESNAALWTNFDFCCSINIMLLLCEKKSLADRFWLIILTFIY